MSIPYLLALHSIAAMANDKLRLIIEYYNHDCEKAWHDSANWQKIRGITPSLYRELIKGKDSVDVDSYYERFLSSQAKMVTCWDDDYPQKLQQIFEPPVLLFYYGELPLQHDVCIAMIGSRTPSYYGKQIAPVLAHEVAEQGIVVVTGMARGIDSYCNLGALDAKQRTIAVLGSGLDVVYPPENKHLYREIIQHGAVVSEFPFGSPPLKTHFPIRNRIISGLSDGIVVIEAKKNSGSLITVEYGLQQNKDIFAVPGNITGECSQGTNNLLREGVAQIVLGAEDIYNQYADRLVIKPVVVVAEQYSDEQQLILNAMPEPTALDEIARKIKMDIRTLSSKLTVLEIDGLVKKLPGQKYVSNVFHKS